MLWAGIETAKDLLVAGALLLVGIFIQGCLHALFSLYQNPLYLQPAVHHQHRLMSSYMRAPIPFTWGETPPNCSGI
jgi:hypothetical protein